MPLINKISMKYIKLLSILLAVVIISSCSRHTEKNGGHAASIQIKGSDTIVNLIQVWAERFVADKPDINIGVTGGGSGTGFAALMNNTCDIAMSSREIEDKERDLAAGKGIEPVEFIVGLDGLAILINKNNPVNNLTIEQLRDIFTAKITNWNEVGGENRKIVMLSRESNSGTHMFFKEHVLRHGDKKSKTEFAPQALMMPSSQAIYDEVYQNPNALGYVGMGFINDGVKAISVAVDSSSAYIYPTPEDVISGKYPISRPLYLYTNGKPAGVVKDFIDYALSDEGQKIVLETDFVPLKGIK
jgi:phosphate transport system substrate-binding protein